ncbi:iron complex outermembrane recepter protein [Cruoricaptor ignavus]|uniref:Iron complex outermembrane recepter protein n=1 Tax=Cruoricaptor ignavus TaxID=1118202 RepID=A0A1M6HKK8_9FLAO|nr:TonB-dependent receptor plug domain-containing protein [Cruoricaptor ignavus]SHJ22734.1 iron complex outermembrane recepter protein [Cruoricaptor ignavus]
MKKAICAIGVLTISTAYAQNIKNDTITQREIEGVVIVASRKPQKISDIPGTVWVIPKTEIRRQLQSGVPIKKMLSQYIPGIDVGSQGRTNFGQNMRGRSVLLMIDGVTINSLRGVSRELESIDPFNIEKIEVLSGASSIYGGNATGGIINIITKKPEKSGFSGETQLSYLSGFNAKDDKDYRFSQSIAAKGEKMFGRFGVAFQQNGGFYNVQGNQILSDVTQTDLQYNRTVDVLFTGGYKINKQHEITGAIQFFDSRFTGDRSLYLGENYASLLKANPDLFSMQDGFSSDKKIGTTRFMGNVAYRATDVLGGQDAFIQISHREEKLGFYPFPAPIKLDGKSAVLNSASEQNTQLSALKVVLSKKWKSFDLTYGLDVDVEQFEAFRNVFDMKKKFGFRRIGQSDEFYFRQISLF